MCGIWALIKSNPQLTQQIVDSFNKIKKRGPDSSTLHVDRNYIAGFHRLAINDLSVSGNQPFFLSTLEYNYILMANGEIYNHRELETKYDIKINSTSDCAVLLPLFIKLNENFDKFNNELRGEYAIVIFKQHKKTDQIEYFVSTDALSVRPMFYYIDYIKNTNIEIGFASLLGGLSELSYNVQRLDQGSMIIGSANTKLM